MAAEVLIVEDEKDLVTTYERLLQRHGCSVISVGTVHDGLAALDSRRFALVIADLRLPDGTGLDIVRSARRVDGPPVIVVTGFSSSQSRREALEAGATAYVVKPFSVLALSSLIQEALAPPA